MCIKAVFKKIPCSCRGYIVLNVRFFKKKKHTKKHKKVFEKHLKNCTVVNFDIKSYGLQQSDFLHIAVKLIGKSLHTRGDYYINQSVSNKQGETFWYMVRELPEIGVHANSY